jgi:Fur family transcriptional regulator, ferric uptake regulator
MREWLKRPAWKACRVLKPSGVRIPLSPPSEDFSAMEKDTVQHLLEDAGLKKTVIRLALLGLLIKSKNVMSIDELSKALKSNADWSTVYRCLQKFEEKGLVSSVKFDDGVTRFEINHEHHHHRHHIVCRECKSISPIDWCSLDFVEKMLKKKGFKSIEHRLDFSGLCKQCA